jgi:hypothetical protein
LRAGSIPKDISTKAEKNTASRIAPGPATVVQFASRKITTRNHPFALASSTLPMTRIPAWRELEYFFQNISPA